MKNKVSTSVAVLISVSVFIVALIVSLVLLFMIQGNGDQGGLNNGNTDRQPGNDVITSEKYEYKTDISAVADALNTTDDRYLLLANKTNPVGEDYSPEDLVDISAQYTNGGKQVSVVKKVAIAVQAMILEMRANGIDNVTVTSGYRSYSYQETLYNRYFAEEKARHPDWSDEQIKAEVLSYSAMPGTSEHHTGLCIDLITTEMVGLWNFGEETPDNPYDKGFAETAAFGWLKDNAHKFGFILRYPEDKVDVTGYSYESWHYRFVGIDAATKIYNEGISLEEYLGK